MATNIDVRRLRARLYDRLGPKWSRPVPFGPDGWRLSREDPLVTHVIVTCFPHDDGWEWVHASMSHPTHMPNHIELAALKHAVWGPEGWACQVFPPETQHVNIHEYCLHLWGRLDGSPALPDFTMGSGSV